MKGRLFYNYMTKQDARNEYASLLSDDDTFATQWQNTEKDFNEWCEINDIILVSSQERAEQLEELQL
jgi:hypothetical protein